MFLTPSFSKHRAAPRWDHLHSELPPSFKGRGVGGLGLLGKGGRGVRSASKGGRGVRSARHGVRGVRSARKGAMGGQFS